MEIKWDLTMGFFLYVNYPNFLDGDFDGIVMINIEIMGQNPTSYGVKDHFVVSGSTESCLISVCHAAEVTQPLEWITVHDLSFGIIFTAERPSARRDS